MFSLAEFSPTMAVRLTNPRGNQIVDVRPESVALNENLRKVISIFNNLGFYGHPESYMVLDNAVRYTGLLPIQYGYEEDAICPVIIILDSETDVADFIINHNSMNNAVTFQVICTDKTTRTTEIKLDDLETRLAARFEGYDVTPERGWGFMYYLDAATNWRRSWSEADITRIESYLDKGYTLNQIRRVLRNNISVRNVEDFLDLPISWVDKVGEGLPNLLPPDSSVRRTISSNNEDVPF